MVSDDGFFDERVARRYDQSNDPEFDPETIRSTVDLLEELADRGSALELGIGTGRIAVPLAARGIRVSGIDRSRAMVRRLRAKPGGRDIEVTIGDFSTATVGSPGTFSLAYLVFNTILNLTTQAAQVACFRNVARHLRPGGRFVIEVGIPELRRLPPGETVLPFLVGDTRWGFDEYDVANQGLTSHHFEMVGDRVQRLSVPFRYVWPSELDLMAAMAGMRLADRWAGWSREPFTSESRQHVSVWELAPSR
ncbi:MAG TPA: class I SAM-dependent methyltransferase [Candidatus Limnocylindria bacterium]|nr:class I SAM-dependent methyltransferase [Candidatus Limnocylindria bacterium]